jgi:hypothetical protein
MEKYLGIKKNVIINDEIMQYENLNEKFYYYLEKGNKLYKLKENTEEFLDLDENFDYFVKIYNYIDNNKLKLLRLEAAKIFDKLDIDEKNLIIYIEEKDEKESVFEIEDSRLLEPFKQIMGNKIKE